MLVVRTELSESGAHEIAYNVHAGPRVPIFLAVHRDAAIHTTLLQELDKLVDARYHPFSQPAEILGALHDFLVSCRHLAAGMPTA